MRVQITASRARTSTLGSADGPTCRRITATLHGLPKVTHDADIDTDYPVDCDLEDTNAAELALPLPGESTPIGEFNTLIRLSRLLSRTLAELYTTTNRRGSVDKMERLRAQIGAWRQSCLENGRDGSLSPSRLGPWFSLAKSYIDLLIHRPGLTFGPDSEPFRDCLRICTAASSAIIELVTQLDTSTLITGVKPPLSSLVFQCALMVVFNSCHHSQNEPANMAREAGELMGRATAFLGQCACQPGFARSHHLLAAWSDATGLLQALVQAIGSPASIGGSAFGMALDPGQGRMPIEPMHFDEAPSLLGVSIAEPTLDGLDGLESLDWILDYNTGQSPGYG